MHQSYEIHRGWAHFRGAMPAQDVCSRCQRWRHKTKAVGRPTAHGRCQIQIISHLSQPHQADRMPVPEPEGKGSSSSRMHWLLSSTRQLVLPHGSVKNASAWRHTCRMAKLEPMHPWRPPPKPIKEKGAALSSSLGAAKRSGSKSSGRVNTCGSLWL